MSKRSLSSSDELNETSKKAKVVETIKRRSFNSTGIKKAFKSPLVNKESRNDKNSSSLKSPEVFEVEIDNLKKKIDQLNTEIEELRNDGYDEKDLDGVIHKLHVFNDIKDAAQIVLGKLAEIHRVTISEMHNRYEVDEKDS